MSIEAMKLALEAFENLASHWPHYAANMDMKRIDFDAIAEAKKSLEALRAAIEQAEKQEPVAWLCKDDEGQLHNTVLSDKTCKKCFPVYTAPPQREWQGLTDEEREEIAVIAQYDPLRMTVYEYRVAIQIATEAKLKEKNT